MSEAFTPERLSLEEKAKRRIIEVLQQHGAKVLDSKIPEKLSLTRVDSETKNLFKEFLGSKFDILVSRKGEHYLVECKGKSKEAYKNYVNVVEYDAYYKIASLPFPFLYFVWVEETDKVYRHEIVSPKDFERKRDYYGKPMYLIPQNLIHEIRPSWIEHLDVWLRLKPKDIEKWVKETSKRQNTEPSL